MFWTRNVGLCFNDKVYVGMLFKRLVSDFVRNFVTERNEDIICVYIISINIKILQGSYDR